MDQVTADQVDQLEAAMNQLLIISKRPAYWRYIQDVSGVAIDRPAAAILLILVSGSLSFSQLVQRLGVEPPTVSRKTHELESEGLIERQPTIDRRVHQLVLTESGSEVADKLLAAKRQLLTRVLNDLPSDQRQQLSSLLTSFSQAMKSQFSNQPEITERINP